MDQTYQFGGNLQYENVQAAQAPPQSHRKTFNHNEGFRVACSSQQLLWKYRHT